MFVPRILGPLSGETLRVFLRVTWRRLPRGQRRRLCQAGVRALFLKRRTWSAPVFLQVEPTTRCNLACAHCCRVLDSVYPRDMDPADFQRLVDANPGTLLLHLQGLGEPFLHPHFFDMVAYAARRGILVGTCTNGHVLTPALEEALAGSALAYLAVSVDAVGPRLGVLREGSDFALLERNLAAISRRRAPGTLLAFWVVVQERNRDELEGVIALAARYGVSHMLFSFVHSAYETEETGTSLRETATAGALKQCRARLVRVCRDQGLLCSFGVTPRSGRLSHCRWPWLASSILVDGRVAPCCLIRNTHVFGNAFTEPLDRIWHGTAYDRFRRDLKRGNLPEVCQMCQYL